MRNAAILVFANKQVGPPLGPGLQGRRLPSGARRGRGPGRAGRLTAAARKRPVPGGPARPRARARPAALPPASLPRRLARPAPVPLPPPPGRPQRADTPGGLPGARPARAARPPLAGAGVGRDQGGGPVRGPGLAGVDAQVDGAVRGGRAPRPGARALAPRGRPRCAAARAAPRRAQLCRGSGSRGAGCRRPSALRWRRACRAPAAAAPRHAAARPPSRARVRACNRPLLHRPLPRDPLAPGPS
jgi:hypothetical protein